MTIHVALNHTTSYRYDRRVELGPQTIRLRPAPHSRTQIVSYALDISPKEHFINWQQDPFGNFMARVVFPEPVREFVVKIDLVADMAVFNPFDFFLEPAAEEAPFAYNALTRRDLLPYLDIDPVKPILQKWVDSVDLTPRRTIDFLVELNQRLEQEIDYVIRMEPGVQSPALTLTSKRGSCRDSAWLLCQILRNLGFASRFVSGYLIQLKADQEALDGPSGTTQDFTDLHAWTEVYLPGAGWVGMDPTSGLFTGEGHIPLAATPNPSTAAPISGLVGEAECEFSFVMDVRRIFESPRVTKPYTEDEWQAILACGEQVDAELGSNDVRLTVGGEPTFVSIDYPEGDEWNTAAVGPTKRKFGIELIKRLQKRFAPGGVLHMGQGKWYPGEQLPRWAFALYWRRDGQPIWANPKLIADDEPAKPATIGQLEKLAHGIAAALDVTPEGVAPTYEDPWHFLGKEASLPPNLDAANNKLDDPLERERLARVVERGISKVVGFALPVQRWNAADKRTGWRTERWKTRSGKLFLVPGDSPVGYRLPLGSLPWIRESDYPNVLPRDPFAEREPLPDAEALWQQYRIAAAPVAGPGDDGGVGSGDTVVGREVRTAMAFEVRNGILCVFMPPVEALEDYLELLAAVEASAGELDLPIHLEGYPPPHDPRLCEIKVTPDPGVIEVNVQPASSWAEMVEITETLYEEARKTRLDTQKFMTDGRHTGTGGGNHVVLGGARPADSPFLRRPDLLRTLIAYWQQHPSLSYMFSGLFIGPTSQAPRIDEARHDSLHELELAFTEVPRPDSGQTIAPWLVDRIFRNLLIDVTGNTHRAEICIDKLYSPDGPTGRLGLVEFRAFEMPPHARMSLAQQLLLLAIVAWGWKQPNERSLVRWGTRLHDRFMLPEFVWADFVDVVADLNAAGYPIDASWFGAHYEFRFPKYGSVQHGDTTLELRQALEPWHVMGEEGAVGGTARYVDSSLERLQVKVSGFNAERYVVACNGHRVPLASTGTAGEYAGGVRFRAWNPPSSLHPTIGVDVPLVFDLYDRWTGRPVAGCTYHAAHPGGLSPEDFPVNSNAAESRRLARFQPFGHTTDPYPEPRLKTREEFPQTLDLRWP